MVAVKCLEKCQNLSLHFKWEMAYVKESDGRVELDC